MTTAKTTNLTELGLNRAILKMSLPTIMWMLSEALFHLVDSYWVGKLGAEPMAAASSTAFFLWIFFAFADVSGVANNALASQAVGAGRSDKVREYLRRSLLVALIFSTVIAGICWPLRRLIFAVLGLEPEVVDQAATYLEPWLIGMPIIYIAHTMGTTFRAVGDPATPTVMMFGLVIVNGILDPLLIFGWGPVPAMGLAGAAWCSVICHFIFLIPAALILARRGLLPRLLSLDFFRARLAQLSEIVRIGLPIATNGAFFSLTYVGLTWVIAKFGSESVAAIGVGHRLESFPWFFAYGFSIAASTLVGQYIGAGKPKEAGISAWRCCFSAALFILAFLLVILFAVEPVIAFFIDDPQVVAIGSTYLRIAAACWLVGVFDVVLEGAFSGAGYTLPPMLIGIPLTALRIPAAYVLAITMGYGTMGIWWAIGASSIIKGVLMIIWFARGTWKERQRPAETVHVESI